MARAPDLSPKNSSLRFEFFDPPSRGGWFPLTSPWAGSTRPSNFASTNKEVGWRSYASLAVAQNLLTKAGHGEEGKFEKSPI